LCLAVSRLVIAPIGVAVAVAAPFLLGEGMFVVLGHNDRDRAYRLGVSMPPTVTLHSAATSS